jgi:hypothetical protein
MENKGTKETITYPSIYFTVDNFEDVRLETDDLNDYEIFLVDFL